MPTYDYGCEACGATWELEQRISADPVKKCPKCGKRKAKRMISGGNFILKGGGWYADGYGSSSSSSSSGASGSGSSSDSASSSDSGSDSSSSSSSDTKAETKTTASKGASASDD